MWRDQIPAGGIRNCLMPLFGSFFYEFGNCQKTSVHYLATLLRSPITRPNAVGRSSTTGSCQIYIRWFSKSARFPAPPSRFWAGRLTCPEIAVRFLEEARYISAAYRLLIPRSALRDSARAGHCLQVYSSVRRHDGDVSAATEPRKSPKKTSILFLALSFAGVKGSHPDEPDRPWL